jgi:hypothetical protein
MQPQPPKEPPSGGWYQQPPVDPYRVVGQMSQVGDAGRRAHWWSGLKLVSGLVGGLLVFFPFGLIASAFWGWWSGESNWGTGGWVTVLLGLTAGMCVGSFLASES